MNDNIKPSWPHGWSITWVLAKFFFFFFRVFGPNRSRKKGREKRVHRTSSVNKGFIIWLSGKVFLRDTADSPERAR